MFTVFGDLARMRCEVVCEVIQLLEDRAAATHEWFSYVPEHVQQVYGFPSNNFSMLQSFWNCWPCVDIQVCKTCQMIFNLVLSWSVNCIVGLDGCREQMANIVALFLLKLFEC